MLANVLRMVICRTCRTIYQNICRIF